MNAQIIASANQKGGVGKTTTTVNLGVALAREGKRVLLVDGDPQGSLTISMGYPDPDELSHTLATAMMGEIEERSNPPNQGIIHHAEGVDLLPGNIELSGVELSLFNTMSRELVLRNVLNKLRGSYDYIIIDCMPSLGLMTINSLAAADSVIIPLQPNFLSTKSCHTALRMIQNRFTRCKWFVEGDIKGFFDNIDHNVMIGILRKRIKDERFLRLIRKFLNAGYMEDNQLHQSYSGTPQGGIISPILANIYLDQFDKYMAEFKKRFDRGDKRAYNAEYLKLSNKRIGLKKKLAKARSEEEKQSIAENIRELDKIHKSIPCKDPMDANFRRLQYVRYADDFLIGIIGAKEDAQAVKQEIGTYIAEQLKLELSDEKTLVTKATDRAKFLGFEIRATPQSNHTKKTKRGCTARNYSGHIMLEVPTSAIKKKLLALGAMKIEVHNGAEIWKSTHRGELVGRTDLSILDQYNGEIRGFCNYYAIANNRSKLHKFRCIMEYSFYKTLACKYRTTKRKIMEKYRVGKDIGVKFQDKHGNDRIRLLWKGSLAKDPYPLGKEADIIHKPKGILKKPSLGVRLKANRCEWCGRETSTLVMHQVRTLKELDESQPWAAFMKKINRKTLVVCESCHSKIHRADCE